MPNIARLMVGVMLANIVPVVMFLLVQHCFILSVASSGIKG